MMDLFKAVLIVALFGVRVHPYFKSTWNDAEGLKILVYVVLFILTLSILEP
jgi:hypothetical protein